MIYPALSRLVVESTRVIIAKLMIDLMWEMPTKKAIRPVAMAKRALFVLPFNAPSLSIAAHFAARNYLVIVRMLFRHAPMSASVVPASNRIRGHC